MALFEAVYPKTSWNRRGGAESAVGQLVEEARR